MQSRPTKRAGWEMSKVLTRPTPPGTIGALLMNPLPRFVAMALFVVLAALVALLAVPVWRDARTEAAGNIAAATPSAHGNVNATAPRVLVMPQRLSLTLAAAALLLTVLLTVSLASGL